MTESFIEDPVRAWLGMVGSIPFVSWQLHGIRNLARLDQSRFPVYALLGI